MAVKFNKEMLLKHRFWIMLGVSVMLTMVGIIILQLSEAEGRVLLGKSLKGILGTPVSDGPKSLAAGKENAEKAKKYETQVWKEAYEPQAALFTWPKPVEDEYDFANGYFANEVKVAKLADPNPKNAKSWPADNAFLMHGAYVQQGNDWFEIKDRNGVPQKFFVTKRSEKIVTEDGKLVGFDKLNESAKKKLLAVGYQRGKYFGDQLTPNESRLFKANYLDQISPLLKSVDPFDSDGKGVVQLKGWLYQDKSLPHEAGKDYPFIRYVSAPWPPIGKEIHKEAWIAQEDLWIQTEIYRMIKSANDGISTFAKQFKDKGNERNKAYAFQNSYFDLELVLDKNDALSFKIKNRLPRKQSIDLKFRVLLNSAKGHKEEVIDISGLPLTPAGSKDNGEGKRDYFTKSFPKGKDDRTGIYSVQQVLSWQTAAVKRIDLVSIGSNGVGDVSNSQRTYTVALRPFDDKDLGGEPGKVLAPAGPTGKFPIRKGPKGGFPSKDILKKPAGGVGNVGADKLDAALGLWTHRYIEVTEQARRVPVAVVLIVDQGHVDRVLTAFNNSKLRFLETQVLLNQFTGSLQPPVVEDKNDPGPAVRPPGFGPKFPGVGPAMPKAPEPGGGADLETNIELVIYGIVTLYQRYPLRPALAPLEK